MTSPAMPRIIHAVGFQSVDPDQASIGGSQWDPDRAEIDAFIETFRKDRMEVDFEFLRHALTVPADLEDYEAITEWVDDAVWARSPERRVVLLGSVYPGGEQRRIAAST